MSTAVPRRLAAFLLNAVVGFVAVHAAVLAFRWPALQHMWACTYPCLLVLGAILAGWFSPRGAPAAALTAATLFALGSPFFGSSGGTGLIEGLTGVVFIGMFACEGGAALARAPRRLETGHRAARKTDECAFPRRACFFEGLRLGWEEPPRRLPELFFSPQAPIPFPLMNRLPKLLGLHVLCPPASHSAE